MTPPTEDSNESKNHSKTKDEGKGDAKPVLCSYFNRNSCRHGYSGNVPKNGVEKCAFSHPPLCRKYVNKGMFKGGCNDKNCSDHHPKMCASSLKDRKCSKMGSDVRCTEGYHLKNTTAPTKDETKSDTPKESEVNLGGLYKDEVRSFLGQIIKEQIMEMFGLLLMNRK